jgi:hypothetical protein
MSEQIALAFLDWLAAECAAHPVILVLEDLQWGDALTVKLLEGALRDLERGSLFLLALGRPEVEEIFPKLLGGQRAVSLSLRALSSKASELLVRGVLGEGIGGDALERMIRLSAGNALFLEELIRAAAEGKVGDVPETVLAMLQSRLSRLEPEARLVLRPRVSAARATFDSYLRGDDIVTDTESGPLRDYYELLQAMLRHVDIRETERSTLAKRRDVTIRLLFYDKSVKASFAREYRSLIVAGYDAVGMPVPDFSRLSRKQALAAITGSKRRPMPSQPRRLRDCDLISSRAWSS